MSERTDPLMVAFYAAVQTIENGQASEIELEHCTSNGECESTLSIVIRREILHIDHAL